jgi:hypothetical protein
MKNTEIYTDTPDMRFECEIKREEKFPMFSFSFFLHTIPENQRKLQKLKAKDGEPESNL